MLQRGLAYATIVIKLRITQNWNIPNHDVESHDTVSVNDARSHEESAVSELRSHDQIAENDATSHRTQERHGVSPNHPQMIVIYIVGSPKAKGIMHYSTSPPLPVPFIDTMPAPTHTHVPSMCS